jgi:hypothetical protein
MIDRQLPLFGEAYEMLEKFQSLPTAELLSYCEQIGWVDRHKLIRAWQRYTYPEEGNAIPYFATLVEFFENQRELLCAIAQRLVDGRAETYLEARKQEFTEGQQNLLSASREIKQLLRNKPR